MSVCSFCRTEDLTWQRLSDQQWRLFDTAGVMHKCPEMQLHAIHESKERRKAVQQFLRTEESRDGED
jgi:hypothetical protein